MAWSLGNLLLAWVEWSQRRAARGPVQRLTVPAGVMGPVPAELAIPPVPVVAIGDKSPAAKPEALKPAPAVVGKVAGKPVFADEAKLAGVHPDLVRVVLRARRDGAEFRILEGLRTKERQVELFAQRKSQTMNSRHLTGHAVDLAPLVGGSVTWDWKFYFPLAERVKAAAKAEGVPLEWGGDWVTFKDGPHWQLPARSPFQNGKPI